MAEPRDIRLTARFGIQYILNGDDEHAYVLDANITPAGALDIGNTSRAFGMFVGAQYAAVDRRIVLASKRDSNDLSAAVAGWIIERDEDNRILVTLDDGTTKVQLQSPDSSAGYLVDDKYHHMILVNIDRVNDQAELWFSAGINQHSIRKVDTADISGLTDSAVTSTAPFSIGAMITAALTRSFFADVGFHWVGAWNRFLPEEMVRSIARMDLPFPEDPRIVSLWHFTQKDLTDWNSANQNDLAAFNTGATNFISGPERCGIVGGYQITPSAGGNPGTASFTFDRFRPDILQDFRLKIIGNNVAPAMRLVRTTGAGAGGNQAWTQITAMSCLRGRYAFVFNTPSGAPNDNLVIYDARLEDEIPPGSDTFPWLSLGNLNDGDFANMSAHPDTDNDGKPNYLYFMASGQNPGSFSEFFVLDITDPTSPSIAGRLAGTGNWGTAIGFRLITDARGNDVVWFMVTGGTIWGIDVSTPGTPTVKGSVSNSQLDSATQEIVQVGDYLFCTWNRGLTVVDISDPTAPVFDAAYETDLAGSNDDSSKSLVVLNTGRLMTNAPHPTIGGQGRLTLWDIVDPTDVKLVQQSASVEYTDPFEMHRIGGTVLMIRARGATTTVVLIDVANPDDANSLRPIGTYELAEWLGGAIGAQTNVDFRRDRMLVQGNAIQQGAMFKFDDGEGFSGLTLNRPAPGFVVRDEKAEPEIARLFADLDELDFEDVPSGTSPPTGWNLTGTPDVFETSDEWALTGQIPGGETLARALKFEPDTVSGNNGGFVDYTPQASDMVPGNPYVLTLAYLWEVAAQDLDAVEIIIEERGGVLTASKTFKLEELAVERWFPVRFIYDLKYVDSTTFRITVRDTSNVDFRLYVDAWRFGIGRLPLTFAGRVKNTTARTEEVKAEPLEFTVGAVDNTYDLDRLSVSTTLSSQDAKTSIEELVANFARAEDGYTTDNVSNILGNHDELDLTNNAKLTDAISRVVKAAGGVWYMDYFNDIHALPVGYELSPVFMNDVQFGWIGGWDDDIDGRELVTEGIITGDPNQATVPESTFTREDWSRRFGTIQHHFPATSDVKTGTGADNLRDFFKDMVGQPQRQGAVGFLNEPLLRPGQLLPIQVPVRAYDHLVLIKDVSFTAQVTGAQIAAAVGYTLLQESQAGLLQRGTGVSGLAPPGSGNGGGTEPSEDDEMFMPAWGNQGPFSAIGTVSNASGYVSWLGRAALWDDGASEGMGGTVAIPAAWRGQTVEVFLSFLHRSAAATGDIVVRADLGPRQEPEAAGAPNDAASLRVDTTIVGVATVAGNKQDELRYVSLGTFAIDALDRNLIYNVARQGADASDTFGASIYAFGIHVLVP